MLNTDQIAGFVLADIDQYELTGRPAQRWSERCGMAMAYIWGRQDAGESGRDTGFSQTFGTVYALAHHVAGGYAGPLQAVYHEWHDTGRVLVRQRTDDRDTGRIVQITGEDDHGTTRVYAAYAVYTDDYLPHWAGLVTAPAN